jgi:hypothetical protein
MLIYLNLVNAWLGLYDSAIFLSFPPHYALLFFAQRWHWQSNSNLLYFGGSV